MKGLIKNLIIGLIIPAIVTLVAGTINIWLGIASFVIYICILLYFSRAMIFGMLGSRSYVGGFTDEALKWFKRAYDTKIAGVRTCVSYAYILLKNAELEKSEEVLQQVLKNNPNSPEVPYIKSILALTLWKKGELDAAVNMLEDVISQYRTTSVYGSLGYLLILKGDLQKALQFNLEAFEYNSSDKIIQDNLGQNYYLLDMYDKATEVYVSLLEKSPSFPEPYYNYGLLLLKTGETDKALEMMNKALGYKFSYLSSISKEEVELKIQEISAASI